MRVTAQDRRREEEQHCCAFFEWCQLQSCAIPELKLIYHIPNGGMRPQKTDAQGRTYSVEAVKLKRMGARKGVLDYHLPVPRMVMGVLRTGLWLEFKSGDGRMSDEQHAFAGAMEQQGHVVALVRDWEQAKKLVVQYLGVPEPAIINGRKQ